MQKEVIYKIISRYFMNTPVNKVSLFGSFSRDEENNDSDIDLILNLDKPIGLFTLGKYIADLEDLTKCKIDIATQNSLSQEFFESIENDLKVVYAA